MSENLEAIFWSVIASIIATTLLFFLSCLYKWKCRANFKFHLDVARQATWQIKNLNGFPQDYHLVIVLIDILAQSINGMFSNIYPLWPLPWKFKEKKLIYTILYDILRVCDLSKQTTLGYSENHEHEARLDRIHRYFYKCVCLKKWNRTTVEVQLHLISLIVEGRSLDLGFPNLFRFEMELPNFWDNIKNEFIENGSFKNAVHPVFLFSNIGLCGMKKREYQAYIEKIESAIEKKVPKNSLRPN